ncbi:hypothetical protein [uncultured Polaribacter sp.]|uniref:hypothetical protein n=1 Tax=uncultured Polaribacter sp. TaxID=174711 RepID=UPI002638B930|nr:hypothetical protein [uncultured Polaribacter sp.]
MTKNLLVLSILFSIICFKGFSQEGKLEKAKESLKSSSSSSTSIKTNKSSRSSSANNNDNESFFGSIFAGFFWEIAKYTVYGVAIESEFEKEGKMHNAEISNYPYKESKSGNFIYTDSINYKITRFDIYNHILIENKNLYGNDLGVNFRFLKRFAIDINYTTFLEKVEGKKDSFNMYSALLKYYRIRTQRFDAWFGLGATHIANNVNETGFTFGFGGEIFIKKPISLVGSHKWTTIHQESIRNTKLLLKYHIKNYRISSGYEHYKLAVSKINTFSLGVEISF